MSKTNGERPKANFRLGPRVNASVWPGKNGDGYTVSLQISSKQNDSDEYKNYHVSMFDGDVENAREVLRRASEWIAKEG